MLQYTQLKFKLDPLIKPEILGSIPSEVTNLWTLTRSTGLRDSLLNGKKKSGLISSFGKSIPEEERFFFGVTTYFLFLFLSGENQIRIKTPNDSRLGKSGLQKLDSGFGDQVTY